MKKRKEVERFLIDKRKFSDVDFKELQLKKRLDNHAKTTKELQKEKFEAFKVKREKVL